MDAISSTYVLINDNLYLLYTVEICLDFVQKNWIILPL